MMAAQLSSAASMRSTFCGVQVRHTPFAPVCAPRVAISIEAAHKKGAGSSKNGRDSNAKRRGIKIFGGQEVKAGGIIVRQVGSTWYPGLNVGMGKDYTIFSTVPGIVRYEVKHDFQQISVYPADTEIAQAMVAATHTTQPKEGVPSRQERRKTAYTPRAVQRSAAQRAAATAGSTVSVAVAAVRVSP